MEEGPQIQGQTSKALIKQLASSDTKTRNKSLKILLNRWLPSQRQISEETMKKIWKGLFYCMWHADKSLAQNQLINKLSSLLSVIDDESVCFSYFSVFIVTLRREWSGIDGLRLDKFYLLIRRFVNSLFVLFKKKKWGLSVVERFMKVFVEKGFLADDKLGNGVNYHVASVFVEELKGFLPVRRAVLEVIFGSFVGVMGRVSDKVLLGKIKGNVFDVLLQMGRELLEVKKGDDVGENDEVVVLGSIALVMEFSKKFYELGSSVECCQGNRKVILGLHEVFLKLEKDLVASGIKVSLPESNGDDEDEEEVPTLVPIDCGMEVEGLNGNAVANGPGSKKLKKSKKAKKESDGNSKKDKKKKRNAISGSHSESDSMTDANGNGNMPNGEDSSKEKTGDDNLIKFNESAIANLQRQFEKVAADVDMDEDVASACDFPKVTGNGNVSKKRKRAKSVDGKRSENPELAGQEDAEASTSAMAKSTEKSAKKVRFSMKNNLIWKPSTPLPPQSLRIPPSVTPRGSALKKGVPPGPVRAMPAKKKMKQRAKSTKKVIKGISLAAKRIKKLKSLSI
ncbi:RIBOSOMAL RNA-PROCESSING 1 [Salix koriyanagi]|uniref:RIBOSOMAL RNA-PROCESSING 1 n=1 Tax=Salix koriyanagi TaxID=2511006 RepID=A0A9Q0PGI4_9ROSI|nr:RIBOSOMAL RNA-PROCESSING 1 [Salix koriyanagi]